MVEPSLKVIRKKILDDSKQYQCQFLTDAHKLPEGAIENAQANCEKFITLKEEIEQEMKMVEEQVDILKDKVRANLKSEENPDGLLTCKQDDYFDCVAMEREVFRSLLDKDETHW